MEVLEQNKKEALAMYKEVSTMYGEADLKPDEFLTQVSVDESFGAYHRATDHRLWVGVQGLGFMVLGIFIAQ